MSTCSAIALGVSIVSGKLPVRYSCASVELARLHALPLQPDDLVDHEPQRLAGRLRARVGLGDDVAGVLEGIEVRRGAVGQAALGAQHAVQPVAAFAAEDLHRDVERQVVAVPARQADVADADLGLHGAGPVDDDDAAGRRRRLVRLRLRQLDARPAAERPLRARERLLGRHVADDRQDRVVRAEPPLVEREQVVAASAPAIDAGVPESGLPYGWNP